MNKILTDEEFHALSKEDKIKEIKRMIAELDMTESEAIADFKKSKFYPTHTLH